MARKYTKPTIETTDRLERKRSHPSYAKINISRVSGQAELFQSAFTHQHYIILRISRAYVMGDDCEFVMDDSELIEVAMSETQFARMVTSLNMGSGSPCTLQRHNGKLIDQPINEDQREGHRTMVQDRLKGVMDAQLAVSKQIRDWREAKHRPTLKELDTLAEQTHLVGANFEQNMDFYAQVFEEHMEAIVDDAKTEVETHMLHTAGRLGLGAEHMPQLKMSDGEHPTIDESEEGTRDNAN